MLAVAGYRMQLASVKAEAGTLYVPVQRFFQVGESQPDFEEEVFREVAQTLIDNADAFRRSALEVPDIEQLNRWLNSPQFSSGGAQLFGAGASLGSEPNSSDGFTKSGFPNAVRGELQKCFPTAGAGAVVCVLDNLELLQTSQRARETLEGLRNRVFDVPGIRWVLCGSRGIVSRARSERLSGFFAAPLELGPLSDEAAIELIRRRLEFFGDEEGCYAPVPPESFDFLYRALHFNLRDSLAYAQQFSDWLYAEYIAEEKSLPALEDRQQLLESWLSYEADRAQASAKGIQPRVWQFFDQLAKDGGRCRASDFETFEFNTQQQMGSAVTALAGINLLVRETDPENATRNIHSITPQGWLVFFNRNGYDTPVR